MNHQNSQPLWQPSVKTVNASNMLRFMQQLKRELGLAFEDYQQLHQWSVAYPQQFWQQVWLFSEIRSSKQADKVLSDGEKFPGAKWFSGARLNYAENALRNRTDKTALISRLEDGSRRTLSYAQLYQQVAECAAALRQHGVVAGDRVAGFMPNIPETVVAMLATASIGAIWSSCSPDFGINGVMDRFGQIEPKVLFCCEGCFYNGKTIDCMPRLQQITSNISSIQQLVVVAVTCQQPVINEADFATSALLYNDFLVAENTPELVF